MKIKAFIIFMLCLLLLVGCDSEEEVDQKVQEHINETYGFEIDFIYRESVNEGNMGDRIYQVQRKDDPKIEFTVDLSGMWETEVIADDYEKQKEAYLLSQKFLETYKKEINQLKFTEMKIKKYNDYRIIVTSKEAIPTMDDVSLQPVMEFITLLNRFSESEKFDRQTSLVIYYLENGSIYLENIADITTVDQLRMQLDPEI